MAEAFLDAAYAIALSAPGDQFHTKAEELTEQMDSDSEGNLERSSSDLKLNHLNLTVTNVPTACEFLERYFGLRKMGGNAGLTVLSDDGGFVLTLMKAGKTTDVKYPGNFHIGFFVESEEKVDELNHRLKKDGYDVQPPERHHAYGFYMEAPGGFTVEIGA